MIMFNHTYDLDYVIMKEGIVLPDVKFILKTERVMVHKEKNPYAVKVEITE